MSSKQLSVVSGQELAQHSVGFCWLLIPAYRPLPLRHILQFLVLHFCATKQTSRWNSFACHLLVSALAYFRKPSFWTI